MLKTVGMKYLTLWRAYHLGEGRVLKTSYETSPSSGAAYHLGEGRVLKTTITWTAAEHRAYHLGEGRVLKTYQRCEAP